MAEATSSTNGTMKARKAKPCRPAKMLYCLTIAIIIPINRDLFDQSSQDHLLRIQRCSIKLRCPMLDIANRQVKTLCDTMELHITVPEEKLRLWAEEAFSSGLGGRGIMKKLQTALDEQIFEDPCRDMYSGVDQ